MLKLIAEKIKYYEDLIALLKDRKEKLVEKEDKAYYHGLIIAYSRVLDDFRALEREYEDNVQSVEESMRFLRGE